MRRRGRARDGDAAETPSADARPLLEARHVARRFGDVVALAPADLEVRAGTVVALRGPNAAGKSTLLALLAAALPPTSGSVVRRDGVRVGWAPQRPAHYGRLTARENLELFARLVRGRESRAIARRLLDDLDLPDDARASAALSGGMRQRLNIGIALLGDPDVLLLDEPTAALDAERRERLWRIVARVRDRGGAVVFSTQLADEAAQHADDVWTIEEGRLRR